MRFFSAYVEWDPESKLYVGLVPSVPGGQTQAATLNELRAGLKEVLEPCLPGLEGRLDELPTFVGIKQVEVAG